MSVITLSKRIIIGFSIKVGKMWFVVLGNRSGSGYVQRYTGKVTIGKSGSNIKRNAEITDVNVQA